MDPENVIWGQTSPGTWDKLVCQCPFIAKLYCDQLEYSFHDE